MVIRMLKELNENFKELKENAKELINNTKKDPSEMKDALIEIKNNLQGANSRGDLDDSDRPLETQNLPTKPRRNRHSP